MSRKEIAEILKAAGFKSTADKLGSIHAERIHIYCTEVRRPHRLIPDAIEVRVTDCRIFARLPCDLDPSVFAVRLTKFLKQRAFPLDNAGERRRKVRRNGGLKFLKERATNSVRATDMLNSWSDYETLAKIYDQAL